MLSPSISLEGSWGGFLRIGRSFNSEVTGKQKKLNKTTKKVEKDTNVYGFFNLHGLLIDLDYHLLNLLLTFGCLKDDE